MKIREGRRLLRKGREKGRKESRKEGVGKERMCLVRKNAALKDDEGIGRK